MSLLLLLACLCGAAASGAPTALRCLPESELDGYCRRRRLDGDVQLTDDYTDDGNFTYLICATESDLRARCRSLRLDGDAPLIGGEPASTDDDDEDDDDDDSLGRRRRVCPCQGLQAGDQRAKAPTPPHSTQPPS